MLSTHVSEGLKEEIPPPPEMKQRDAGKIINHYYVIVDTGKELTVGWVSYE